MKIERHKKRLEDYLHLYQQVDIAIIEKGCQPVSATLEGIDWANPSHPVIAERVNWKYSQIKPILRPTFSITGNEAKEAYKIIHKCNPTDTTQDNIYYIDSCLNDFISAELFLWALKKRFDLFGLIKAGIAIDSTTLTKKKNK